MSLVRFAGVVGMLILVVSAGCDKSAPEQASPNSAPAGGTTLSESEYWEVFFIQGSRIGYGQTTVRHKTESGNEVVEIDAVNHLFVKRFGEVLEQETRLLNTETPDGQLIGFESDMQMGTAPARSVGHVQGDRLEIETHTMGKTSTSTLPWSAECRGPHAMRFDLQSNPMEPGQQRTLRVLVPDIASFQVATVELRAVDYEPAKLLLETRKLLRIDTVTHFPGSDPIDGTVWCDASGVVWKEYSEAMALQTYRTTKDVALQKQDLTGFDIGLNTLVELSEPIPNAHRTRQARYRLTLADGDPAEAFVAGPSQKIESTGPNTAELTVYALRPDSPLCNADAVDEPPTDDELQPNNLIQSDNPTIVAMAKEAAGDEQDTWEVVKRLESYVHDLIEEKDFSQAFATAAEVAESRTGDCTEHAVLLAALARARGIPARTAVGLVYMPQAQAFGYHMWTEVYVDGRWIPVDATLALGGIGAAHLKLAHSNLKAASGLSSFLPVVQVTGRLKVETLEVE